MFLISLVPSSNEKNLVLINSFKPNNYELNCSNADLIEWKAFTLSINLSIA